jgi:hypothetical protein
VVGDYFKSNASVLVYAETATELITWLRSKTLVLALLREAQAQADANGLSMIRAVLTRWTAHYMAYRRLLELRSTLTSVVYGDESRPQSRIIIGNAGAKAKAREMI